MSNEAFVTLATNDTYGLGALVLGRSLRRVATSKQTVVLVSKDVSPKMKEELGQVFNLVVTVDILDSGDAAHLALMSRPELGVTFTKLHAWRLVQFSKCVFLDADTLVVQNCDELFEREELSAAPDPGWPDCFNSGVFVFVPSEATFKALLDFAVLHGSFDGGDQGLLNMFFSGWATGDIRKHLPFIYNVVSSATYSYLPALKHFGSQVKIVHFLGTNKPWMRQSQAGTSSPYQRAWWSIFREDVAGRLSQDMAGVAGVLARGEPDDWRREAWEAGDVDYLGRDSFDNIWKRICECVGITAQTLSAPAAPLATSTAIATQPLEHLAKPSPVSESIVQPASEIKVEAAPVEKPTGTAPLSEKPKEPLVVEEKPAAPLLPTQKLVEPLISDDKPVGPVVPAEKPVEPAVSAEKAEELAVPAEKPVEPAVPAEKVVEPLVSTEKPAEQVKSVEKPVEPAVPAEKPVEPVVPTEKPVEPVLSAGKPVEQIVSAEKPVEPAVSAEKQVELVSSADKPVEQIVSAEKPGEPAVSTEKPGEPVPPAGKSVEPAVPAEKPVEPVVSAEKPIEPVKSVEKPVEPVVPAVKTEVLTPAVEKIVEAATKIPVEAPIKEEIPVGVAPTVEKPLAIAEKTVKPVAVIPSESAPTVETPEKPITAVKKPEDPALVLTRETEVAPEPIKPVEIAPTGEKPTEIKPVAEKLTEPTKDTVKQAVEAKETPVAAEVCALKSTGPISTAVGTPQSSPSDPSLKSGEARIQPPLVGADAPVSKKEPGTPTITPPSGPSSPQPADVAPEVCKLQATSQQPATPPASSHQTADAPVPPKRKQGKNGKSGKGKK